jgi:DNA repair protein RadC
MTAVKKTSKLHTSIKNWATDDRPREKLLAKGAEALSDSELLAILINNGHREKSAVDIARELLLLGNNNLSELGRLDLSALRGVKGIGEAKAITIAAALELGRRRHASAALSRTAIGSSRDVADFLRTTIKDNSREVFAILYLNRANKVCHFEIISRGGITGTVADPRLIMRGALEKNATGIILCHNHPSGNLTPSAADAALTQKIAEGARLFDITLLDHIIVSEEGYFSFADEGRL